MSELRLRRYHGYKKTRASTKKMLRMIWEFGSSNNDRFLGVNMIFFLQRNSQIASSVRGVFFWDHTWCGQPDDTDTMVCPLSVCINLVPLYFTFQCAIAVIRIISQVTNYSLKINLAWNFRVKLSWQPSIRLSAKMSRIFKMLWMKMSGHKILL